MGEKQRDKKETILRILWPKQAGKTHTHRHMYIYSYQCVSVCANQVQKETIIIIIIIINWPVAHLISFVYSLHYCALHNLSCQSRFEGEREGKRVRESKLESSPSLSFNCLCLCNFRKHKVKLEFWPSSPFFFSFPHFEKKVCPPIIIVISSSSLMH